MLAATATTDRHLQPTFIERHQSGEFHPPLADPCHDTTIEFDDATGRRINRLEVGSRRRSRDIGVRLVDGTRVDRARRQRLRRGRRSAAADHRTFRPSRPFRSATRLVQEHQDQEQNARKCERPIEHAFGRNPNQHRNRILSRAQRNPHTLESALTGLPRVNRWERPDHDRETPTKRGRSSGFEDNLKKRPG